VNGWVKGYALASLIGVLIATGAFVAYRNESFRDREHARARAAAAAALAGRTQLPEVVTAEVVLDAQQSTRYSFLRWRQTQGGRRLGGPRAPATDKLLYDAAMRAERGGSFVSFLRDGSGRVIAAERASGTVGVAITQPPDGPETYPWLVILGLLAIGALVAAASALVGGRAQPFGLALGSSGLAVPAFLWAGWIAAIAVLLTAAGVALADHRGLLRRASSELRHNRVAYTFLAPAALAMFVLVATPFIIGLVLGFYNHDHGTWTFVGLDNFGEILSGGGRSFDDPLNFWFTLGVTVLWTAINVLLHVSIGVGLALLLREPWLRGKTPFRMLLILPWAIPNYITALIWHGMFQHEHGAVNAVLGVFGIDNVSWFSAWASSFTANVVTNTWLGFPFMMVVALGALESIPRDMYEAAEVDGASAWQRLWHITLPHLRPALAPAVVLGAIWTFNMFNVIYLVSDGRPAGSTDILVTEAYRWAFERGERYGMSAAYATLIFGILLLWTVFGSRIGRKEKTP
jgi:ABC-type sugar transport system permease subunit